MTGIFSTGGDMRWYDDLHLVLTFLLIGAIIVASAVLYIRAVSPPPLAGCLPCTWGQPVPRVGAPAGLLEHDPQPDPE
jgi:hypothetical protein